MCALRMGAGKEPLRSVYTKASIQEMFDCNPGCKKFRLKINVGRGTDKGSISLRFNDVDPNCVRELFKGADLLWKLKDIFDIKMKKGK